MPGIVLLLIGGVVLYEFMKTKTATAVPLSATQLAALQANRAQATQAAGITSALSKLAQALSKPSSGGGGAPKGGVSGGTGSAGTQTGFQSPSNQPFNVLTPVAGSTLGVGDLGPNDVIPGTGMTVAQAQALGFTQDSIAQMEEEGITGLSQTDGIIGSVPEAPTGLDNNLFGLSGAGVPQLDSTGVGTGQDVALSQDAGGFLDDSSVDDSGDVSFA